MRKIAFVTNQIKDCAPIDIISQIIKYIKDRGFEPIVISLRSQKEEDIPNYFPNVNCISLNKSFIELEIFPQRVSRELLGILEKNNVDMVHSHSYQADIICSFLPQSIKKITTQHNIAKEDFYYGQGVFLGKWMTLNLINRLSHFDFIVGVSDAVTNYCHKEVKNKEIPIVTIYNTIKDYTEYSNIDLEKSNRFVYCGSLTKRKDPLLLLNAFVQLLDDDLIPANSVLEIFGDGILKEKVMALASKYPNNIFFKGFVSEPFKFIANCDVFVSCSLSEGLGLSLIEAISLGLIPVCTDIPAFNEIIGDCSLVKDLQFRKGDINSLKKSIVKSINIDAYSISDFRDNIIKKFIGGDMAAKYFDTYLKLKR